MKRRSSIGGMGQGQLYYANPIMDFIWNAASGTLTQSQVDKIKNDAAESINRGATNPVTGEVNVPLAQSQIAQTNANIDAVVQQSAQGSTGSTLADWWDQVIVGSQPPPPDGGAVVPWWVWVGGGVALVVLIKIL